MHGNDAFGRASRRSLRLLFIGPDDASGSSQEQGEPEATGFPANTAIAEMTTEEELAYWKHKSRKHETLANARADYDDIKDKAAQFDQLQAENASEAERQVNAARAEGFANGETVGAERYLKDAVTARFQSLTGKSDDDVQTAFAHVDVHSFIGDDGEIDTTALKQFANTFGASHPQAPSDPIAEALRRQRGGSGGDGSGSIAAIREATREKLAPSTK